MVGRRASAFREKEDYLLFAARKEDQKCTPRHAIFMRNCASLLRKMMGTFPHAVNILLFLRFTISCAFIEILNKNERKMAARIIVLNFVVFCAS